jgi:peroxiredoxin Q/BCP
MSIERGLHLLECRDARTAILVGHARSAVPSSAGSKSSSDSPARALLTIESYRLGFLMKSSNPPLPITIRGRQIDRLKATKGRHMSSKMSVGDKAPNFRLPLAGGGETSLTGYKGQTLVLYFYPKADTAGCTAEARDFSNLASKFGQQRISVLGISPDPVPKLEKFQSKHKLTVALASDESHETLKAYGVWAKKSMYGRTYMGILRSTFLIGSDGRIAKIWSKVRVPGHADEVLTSALSHQEGRAGPKAR